MRHHARDLFDGFLIGGFVVNQDFAHVVRQIVTQRTRHGIAFAIQQERRRLDKDVVENRLPDLQQRLYVPGQFLRTTVNARGAKNHTHAIGDLDIVQGLSGHIAIFTDDAS